MANKSNQQYQSEPLYLGIDVGGTKILIVVGSQAGRVYGELTIPTPVRESPFQVVSHIAEATYEILRSLGLKISMIQAIGVGVAGAIDQLNGIVVHSPHLTQWANVNLKELIENQLHKPTTLDNDANTAALAEFHLGHYKGAPSLLFVTISTGIGAGLVIHGEVYRGRLGFAGEVGHMPIPCIGSEFEEDYPSTLESLASGTGLVSQMKRKIALKNSVACSDNVNLDLSTLSAEDLFTLSSKGNQIARSVIEDGVKVLGLGFTSLVNILDPGVFVIGGGLSSQWDRYIQPAVTIMRNHTFAGIGKDLIVTAPKLRPRSGAIGGLLLASKATGTMNMRYS